MERRHSLVTGANRGLGLALVQPLLQRGDHVIASCRQPGKATVLNQLAGEYPGRLHVLPLDVTDCRSHRELARELALVTEGDPIQLLINNAGVLHGGERFGSLDEKDLDASFQTNARGPLLLTQTLADQISDGGCVANISSEIGSIALRQQFRTPSYAIGKAAQNMATVLLALALQSRRITVLALHPGWVRTDMGGEQAALSPAQSASGLLQVISQRGLDDSGGFFDWQNQALPW